MMRCVRFPALVLVMAGLAVTMGCGSSDPAGDDARALAVVERQEPPKRLALIIGNSRYGSAPLRNPVNDAALMNRTLKELGFSTRLHTNRSQREMKAAIREFGAALQAAAPNAVGVFYYAGHGVQVNGRNYLIPVDARIDGDADVDIEGVSADAVLDQMRESRNRLNFLILDACRNNPFTRSSRSASRGLAQMDAPAGVLIAYSTAPGATAADGRGRNSPYSEALARTMRDSDMPAELMFKAVRDEVMRATLEKQTPWESSSLTGQNFYFASANAQPRLAQGPVVAEAAPPPTLRVTSVQRPTAAPPAPALEPAPPAGPASSSRGASGAVDMASSAGRKVAGFVAGFGKGVYDGTKDVVRPQRSRTSSGYCKDSQGRAVECSN